jgi:hypothetical protein
MSGNLMQPTSSGTLPRVHLNL